MESRCSSRLSRRARRQRLRRTDFDMCSWLELILPGGDDALALLNSLIDYGVGCVEVSDLEPAQLDGAIRLDHIGEEALCSALHRRRGHRDHIAIRAQQQARV